MKSSLQALNDAHKSLIQTKFITTGMGCLKDHPLSFSDINTLRKKMLPDGENAKCFAECLFKKLGLMDDMGKLSSSGAKENAMHIFKDSEEHIAKVEEFVKTCSTVNAMDLNEAAMKSCDRAKHAFDCLVENAPKFGFDVNF
ncbi:uncharacterized protein LOC113238319 [Hyposmocoma kahamanoa]|uniref:uncharacterized protein LOC113238319 n=1 Tax=Hyposmocoma kahamanoa TaxID=1477025 RepID=UPI000E6D839F|nr:uncharacterized protein LOC113238319 [Hyposmocoma kahamanoa]